MKSVARAILWEDGSATCVALRSSSAVDTPLRAEEPSSVHLRVNTPLVQRYGESVSSRVRKRLKAKGLRQKIIPPVDEKKP